MRCPASDVRFARHVLAIDTRILTVVLHALLLLAAQAGVACGQAPDARADINTGGLTIEAIAGWDGTVDHSLPVPISLLLSNYSGRDIDGFLILTNPATGSVTNLGKVFIGQGGTRTFSAIQALPDWFECYVTLISGREILWRRELVISSGNTFDRQSSFALFIEDSDRKPQFPSLKKQDAATANLQSGVAGPEGRRVVCLNAKPWQIPRHPGPLMAVQAIIFPEDVAVDVLDVVQFDALTKWMCLGGTVFVHDDSTALIDQLTDLAPLVVGEAAPSDAFQIRRAGLGSIREYSSPLFVADSGKALEQMSQAIARLTYHPPGSVFNAIQHYGYEAGKADYNRLMVLAFFALYTCFSGFIALLLFRLGRRQIAIYTVTVVVGASVLAAILGGVLRSSQGDLRLFTVTRITEGGLVQTGRIEVRSAGSRNTQVTVNGEQIDVQLSEGEPASNDYYNYGVKSSTGAAFPPFTWQPNLARSETGTYEVHVPMTPWGTRQLRATAFKRQPQPLGFELTYEASDSEESDATNVNTQEQVPIFAPRGGNFSVRLVNNLPVTLRNCQLYVGVTGKTSIAAAEDNAQVSYGPYGWQSQFRSPDGQIDVYQTQSLGSVGAGQTSTESFPAQFSARLYPWDMGISVDNANLLPPRISRLGTASAWIIAQVDESPILKIDELRTEFVPHHELHVFVQEILPEEMPDASLFLKPSESADE